jgi:hypothetical protein
MARGEFDLRRQKHWRNREQQPVGPITTRSAREITQRLLVVVVGGGGLCVCPAHTRAVATVGQVCACRGAWGSSPKCRPASRELDDIFGATFLADLLDAHK